MKKNICPAIIPAPKKCRIQRDSVSVTLSMRIQKAAWQSARQVFSAYTERLFGLSVREGDGILLFCDEQMADNAYRLSIAEDVRLFAGGYAGAMYGLATLVQMLRQESGQLRAVRSEISDWPDTDYRGLMIDLARKWHPFETLLRYVDLCWFYKINKLQLHFTDNQSFTLPSRAFPRLMRENAYYTPEQLCVLNAYAAARSVALVPELDLPGHSKVLTTEYPDLFGGAAPLRAGQADTAICLGRADVFDNVEKLLYEMLELFPQSDLVHVGGDEVDHSLWDGCPRCAVYRRVNGLRDAAAMYNDFVRRITDTVLRAGRTPIVWEGFPKEGSEQISRDVIVMGWESYYHLPPDLVAEGFRVINCSWQPLYIVPDRSKMTWAYPDVLQWNLYRWQNFYELSPAHEHPIQMQPTDRIIGAQVCAWEGDYMQEMSCVRENLAALSERVWTVNRQRSAETFADSLAMLSDTIGRLT